MKYPKALSLFLFVLLAGFLFADLERPVLIPYPSGGYVYVAVSDYNDVWPTRSDVTVTQLTDLMPESWNTINITAIGPIPITALTAKNPRYIDTTTNPAQLLMASHPDWQSNCTLNQSISNRSNWPHTCASPRLQLYLPSSSIDLTPILSAGVENRTYRYDGFYYYFRAHATANGTVGLTRQGARDIVEFDFANPSAVSAELLWLSQTGVLPTFQPDEALRAGVLLSGGSSSISLDSNQTLPLLLYVPATQTQSEYSWPQPSRIDALRLRHLELPGNTVLVTNPQPILPTTPLVPCTGSNCAPVPGAPSTIPSPPTFPTLPPAQALPAVSTAVPPLSSGAAPSASSPSLLSSWPSWLAPALLVIGIAMLAILAFYFVPPAMLVRPPQAPLEPVLLSDSRMALMQELREVERIPTDLSDRLGKSKATVVEQLDGLVQSGLVERVETPGKKFVFYRLTQAGRQALLQFQNEKQAAPDNSDVA